MADTKRTQAAILALLADNTNGAISPQDMRDAVVSTRANQGDGWVFQNDSLHGVGTEQNITADTRTKLECDGAGSLSVTHHSADIGTAYWDGTGSPPASTFYPEQDCAYIFRLTYKISTTSGAASNYVSTELDIGAGGIGTGPVIWASTDPLIKGANVTHAEQFTIPLFAEPPFPTNGGTFFIESNVACKVWDCRIFFARIYKPDN